MKYIRSIVITLICGLTILTPLMYIMYYKWVFNILLIEDWIYKFRQYKAGTIDPLFVATIFFALLIWLISSTIISIFFEKKINKEKNVNQEKKYDITNTNKIQNYEYQTYKPVALEITGRGIIPPPSKGTFLPYAKKTLSQEELDKIEQKSKEEIAKTKNEESSKLNIESLSDLEDKIEEESSIDKIIKENKTENEDENEVWVKELLKSHTKKEKSQNQQKDEQKNLLSNTKALEKVSDALKDKGYEIFPKQNINKIDIDFLAISNRYILSGKIINTPYDIKANDFNENATNWLINNKKISSPVFELDQARNAMEELMNEVMPEEKLVNFANLIIITNGNLLNAQESKNIWEEKNTFVVRCLNGKPDTLPTLEDEIVDKNDSPASKNFHEFVEIMIEYFEEDAKINITEE